jgi:hypothetical protein
MWKVIPAFGGRYEASETGEIRHSLNKNIRKPRRNKFGYLQLNFSRNDGTGKSDTILVHRLIALTFIPNPLNLPEVNHKDGNKQNNHIDNLEWCNDSQNQKHAYEIGLQKSQKGEKHVKAKLTDDQAKQVKQLYAEGISQQRIADFFNVSQTTISKIIRGIRYDNN